MYRKTDLSTARNNFYFLHSTSYIQYFTFKIINIRNMDYKKSNAPGNTVTRDIVALCEDTGNIYETVEIIARRANQIGGEMKHDLDKKLQEFATTNDNLDEVFENREQIEISRYYEKLPKPTLIATQEYQEGKVYWRLNQNRDDLNTSLRY